MTKKFMLSQQEPNLLAGYLREKSWIGFDETVVRLSKPGEGNMNLVLRVETEKQSFIVKQSRGYVEKYPQVPAPENRVVTEAAFYNKIKGNLSIQKYMPQILGIDAENNVMALEDLGKANDFSVLYHLEKQLTQYELAELVDYLNNLHFSQKKTAGEGGLTNSEMRQLNHQHIFVYPFENENGFDLNSVQNGLEEIALPFKNNNALKRQIKLLGEMYLTNGTYLLHGDFYPGSWLKSSSGVKIIDPEFCFYGLREFDLGVLLAHLHLTQQNESSIFMVLKEYHAYNELNLDILNGFTGTEILRRLIGLAQLPLKMELETKRNLMELAQHLILKGTS